MKKHLIMMVFVSILVICCSCYGNNDWWNTPPAKKLASYKFDPSKPLADRVTNAPDFVLDLLTSYDADYLKNNNLKYTAYTPTTAELAEIRKYINTMPKGFAGKIAPRLLGIYFVNNLLGSGLTDFVPGAGNKKYFFTALNPDVLKLSASEWITKKERSCFVPDPAYNLEINIGEGASGFYYIFFHEITHGYDYVGQITPGEDIFDTAKKYDSFKKENPAAISAYPFIDRIWLEYRKPVAKYDYAGRDKITFYGLSGGPKMKISEAPGLYKKLQGSPFVSIYGSMSWMEDFAEYAAMYMSVKQFSRPWTLTIKKNGKTVFVMKDILNRKNIKDRVKFIEGIMK